jgi:DNA mismatch repair protein MutS2
MSDAIADAKTLAELEFDQVLAGVATHASCALGRDRVRALVPLADRSRVDSEIAAVGEARLLAAERPELSFATPLDARFLSLVGKQGLALEPEMLVGLRDTYCTVAGAQAAVRRLEGDYPLLEAEILGLPHHADLAAELDRVFTPRGEIADTASPDLAALRREQRSLVRRVEQLLERLLGDPGRSRYLAEDYFTVHTDRYVVLVKAEFKGKVPGLVQGESSSGLSLYVEPLEIVELNNACIEARVEEAREVRRILRELSDRVHSRRDDMQRLLDGLGWLDSVAARARHATACEAVPPRFATGLGLALAAARHPLLADRCVPLDLALAGDDRVVVLSGVNSGGKTVALKTVGLLVLMAQSGLHVPAGADTVLPFVDRVASEIGDQQSLSQNLSSFSSHVTHVSSILSRLGTRSLLLFDEFMTGTDPDEGAALAEAILADLAARGDVLALVTTHYGPLKLLPRRYERFLNVAVEFDWERLAPTFRLLGGVPGSSLGLDIATRFGIPDRLVAAARDLVESGRSSFAGLVAELEAEHARARAAREELSAALESARRERDEQTKTFATLEKERLAELSRLKEHQIDEMESFKARVHEALRPPAGGGPARPPPQLTGEIQERIRSKEAELAVARRAAHPPASGLPAQGDWVRVHNMREPGIVVELRRDGRTAVVLINGVKVRASLEAMERIAPPSPPAAAGAARPPRGAAGGGASFRLAGSGPEREINLIGLTVDEALEQLGRYLDAAAARGYREVRVVHGRGTGRLREAIARYLKSAKLVRSFRPGRYGEGEGGVTIVEL